MSDITPFHFCCILAGALLFLCVWGTFCDWCAARAQQRRCAKARAVRARAKSTRSYAQGAEGVKLSVPCSTNGGQK